MTVLDPERFGEHMLASTITHRDTVWTLYGRFMNFIFKKVHKVLISHVLQSVFVRQDQVVRTAPGKSCRRGDTWPWTSLDHLGPPRFGALGISWHLLASDRKGAEYLRNVEPVQKTSKNKLVCLVIDGYWWLLMVIALGKKCQCICSSSSLWFAIDLDLGLCQWDAKIEEVEAGCAMGCNGCASARSVHLQCIFLVFCCQSCSIVTGCAVPRTFRILS